MIGAIADGSSICAHDTIVGEPTVAEEESAALRDSAPAIVLERDALLVSVAVADSALPAVVASDAAAVSVAVTASTSFPVCATGTV